MLKAWINRLLERYDSWRYSVQLPSVRVYRTVQVYRGSTHERLAKAALLECIKIDRDLLTYSDMGDREKMDEYKRSIPYNQALITAEERDRYTLKEVE